MRRATGTDLGRHARMLSRLHDAVLSGDARPGDTARGRRLVTRSWDRVRAQGVDPDAGDPPGPLDAAVVEQRRATSPLVPVLPALRAALTSVAEDARHVMVVCDADGVLLWREGSTAVRRRADALGFTEGAEWSEQSVGTNAIGTALAEGGPVQIFSAEHFVRSHHGWTCTAAPVHDPRSGELLGVVDLSGPAETIHPTTVALVDTAVRLAEAGLWQRHEARLDALRPSVPRCSPATPAGSGRRRPRLGRRRVRAARVERVAAPAAERLIAVHGLGPCLPEPVPGGWLLRPASGVRREQADAAAPGPRRPSAAGRDRGHHPLGAPALDPARRGPGAARRCRGDRAGRGDPVPGALRRPGTPGDRPCRDVAAAPQPGWHPAGPPVPDRARGRAGPDRSGQQPGGARVDRTGVVALRRD
ncbi:GAF domain-containing protein [Pseudonocardia sp. ICBG1293]|uniref:GAF domain-containing protein n=1 Tax=Pseudonocardia sp. ICBG1293 TaxID=2844382 RepID=UPI001CCDA12D|nr:GAF domain-containing protein [Pseudonocardia sp. ICBG1293]